MPWYQDDQLSRIAGPSLDDWNFSEDRVGGGGEFGGESAGRSFAPKRVPERIIDMVSSDLKTVAPFAGAGIRISAMIGGGMLTPAFPPAGAVIASAIAEPFAQKMDEWMIGTEPSLGRGIANVAWAGIPPLLRSGKRVAQAGLTVLEGAAANVGFEQTHVAMEEGRWLTGKEAGKSAAIGGAFGGAFAAYGFRQMTAAQRRLQITRAEMPKRVVKAHTDEGGATFDLDGHNLDGQDAWAVGIFPDRTHAFKVDGEGVMDPSMVAKFTKDNPDLFNDPRVKLGTWADKIENADGLTTTNHMMDPVVLVADKDLAMSLGRKYNQKGIWHLKDHEFVPTGGTGDNPGNLPSLRDRLREIPADGPPALEALASQARGARDWLVSQYKASALAGQSGAINLDALVPALAAPRATGKGGKLGRGPRDTLIGQKLRLAAADDIRSSASPTFEHWAVRMREKLGPQVERHLPKAWREGQAFYAKVMAKTIRTELPDTHRAMELIAAGRDPQEWYGPTKRELTKTFGEETDLFLKMVAVTSAQRNIQDNLQDALKVFVQYKAGARTAAEFHGVLGRANVEKAILAKEGEKFSGPKVSNFYKALMGDTDAVVIDRWMLRHVGWKPGKKGELGIDDFEYEFLESFFRDQAAEIGMTPAAFQEGVWKGLKRAAGTTGRHTEQPYWQVMRGRQERGEALFNPRTMAHMLGQEDKIARELESVFAGGPGAGRGQAGPQPAQLPLPGPLAPPGTRPGRGRAQAGSVSLDALLPMWAITQAAKGVRTFGQFVSRTSARFGNSVRRLDLRRAWALGSRRALRLASTQTNPPLETRSPRGAAGVVERSAAGVPTGSQGQATPLDVAFRQLPETQAPFKHEPTRRMPSDRVADRKSYRKAFGDQRAGALVDMSARYSDDINRQTRGVQSDARRQDLADAITWDLDALAAGRKVKPGTILNSEEVKSLVDLTGSLLDDVEHLAARRTANPDAFSKLDDAELVEKTMALQSANSILYGAGSELGRAMRTLRAAWASRDGGSTAFVQAARRRGADPDQISQIMTTFGTPMERFRALQDLQKYGASDLLRHVMYQNMLLRPHLAIKTTGLNALSGALYAGGRLVAAAQGKLFRRGNQYAQLSSLNPRAFGAHAGVMEGWHKATQVMKKGLDPDDLLAGKFPHEMTLANVVESVGFAKKAREMGETPAADFLLNLHSRALSASDKIFRGIIERMESYSILYAHARQDAITKGLTGTRANDAITSSIATNMHEKPTWLLEHSARVARRYTLQSPAGSQVKKMQDFLDANPATRTFGTFVAPFLRVATNAMKLSGQFTPGVGHRMASRLRQAGTSPEAAVKYGRQTGMGAAEARRAQKSGSFDAEAAQRAGEATLGIALAMPMIAAVGMGLVTGSPPRNDPAEADRLGRERPWNSVKVGDVWLSYNGFALAPQLVALADAKMVYDQAAKKSRGQAVENLELLVPALVTGMAGFLKQGPFEDLTGFTDLWNDPTTSSWQRTLGQYVKPIVPGIGIMEEYNRYADPVSRTTAGVLDPIKAAIPGVSEHLPARVRATGEAVMKGSGIPFRPRLDNPDPNRNEAASLGVNITPPRQKTVKLAGQEQPYRLEIKEQRAIQLAKGTAQKLALAHSVASPSWGRTKAADKRRHMEKRLAGYRRAIEHKAKELVHRGEAITFAHFKPILEGLR